MAKGSLYTEVKHEPCSKELLQFNYEINFMSHYIAKGFNFQHLCCAKDEGLHLLFRFSFEQEHVWKWFWKKKKLKMLFNAWKCSDKIIGCLINFWKSLFKNQEIHLKWFSNDYSKWFLNNNLINDFSKMTFFCYIILSQKLH